MGWSSGIMRHEVAAHRAAGSPPTTRPLMRATRVGVSPNATPVTSWPTPTVTRCASLTLGVPG